ncbi:restriction endonuclease subunit S [Actinobacillus minor]|uniref:restriction endonuclease subunit S n=1 Tax=Actinobacillus minor TaxID=51047 RepID=UPI0023F2B953|nr:restriction endonuclease subunit S [Actinobacillus minor]MDD6911196.1 restriction endonuclease subunit S [Actinobacillus minor]MDY4713725.1 restriction endonuclease subunit S [Actinobacillus minor]
MQQVKWAEYELQELFEVKTSKKRFDANKVRIGDIGHPYVVRTATNNGIKGYLNEDEMYLNEGNTISFGQDTATMFYQEKPYFTGDKIKILKPRLTSFNKKNAQFFIPIMTRAFSSFSWGSSSFSEKIIKSQKLSLPIKPNVNLDKLARIDFDFMENFISQLEAFRLSQLEAYLLVTGLKDYTLTAAEQQALADFENGKVVWGEYKVVDLFDVKNTKNILSRDVVANSGHTPYLSASRENNAVSSYISYNEDLLDKGDCIFIGGKTFVVTYQGQDFYSNDSHNLTLYLKDEPSKTKLNQLFMVSCIYKSLGKRYSWGDSISNKKIQTDWVTLPTSNQQPDYSFMEILISAVQKLVIKDVVRYADSKIAATKQVING